MTETARVRPKPRSRLPSPSHTGDDVEGGRESDRSAGAQSLSERILSSTLAATVDSTADIAKLRKLLALQASGQTQRQIAEHFSKDVRTVRRWAQEAKRKKLVVLEDLKPEEVLADFLFGNAELTWQLRRRLKGAQDAEDAELVLKCVKELSSLSAARIAALARIGLFDGFTISGLKAAASGQGGVADLHEAVRNVETGTNELDQEKEGSTENNAYEPLY